MDDVTLVKVFISIAVLAFVGYSCVRESGREIYMTCGSNYRVTTPGWMSSDYCLQEWDTHLMYNGEYVETYEGWDTFKCYKSRKLAVSKCKDYRDGNPLVEVE